MTLGRYQKMRIVFAIGILLATILLSSCEKEESALAPLPYTPKPGIQTGLVNIESDYSKQVFFDLSNGTIVSENQTHDWELGLATQGDELKIILNESLVMQAGDAGAVSFSSVTSKADAELIYDYPHLHPDSIAIKGWVDLSSGIPVLTNHVYVIDLGKDPAGNQRGYRKMMVTGVDNTQYTLKVAQMDGSNEVTKTVLRNADYDYAYLKIKDGIEEVTIAPEIQNWDLVFGRYMHIFHQDDGSILPYAVTGALMNNYTTTAYYDTTTFDSIDITLAESRTFTDQRDLIGYDWKLYDFDKGYIINDDRVYLIKDNDGIYYKLRFLGFLSSTGEKGTITFEYQQL